MKNINKENENIFKEAKGYRILKMEYIDLELPSGTLWATCNVGASKPEDYGEFMKWEEAQIYNCPSKTQIDELFRNCVTEWVTLNGVCGRNIISKKNGKSIFLPAAGYCSGSSFYDVGSRGYYWTDTLYESHFYHNGLPIYDGCNSRAYILHFHCGDFYRSVYNRCYSNSVRQVSKLGAKLSHFCDSVTDNEKWTYLMS